MRLINRRPSRGLAVILLLLPFLLLFALYGVNSAARLAVNSADKLLPAPGTILETAIRLISEPDKRSGDILFWKDTGASLTRLALGVGIAAVIGLVTGLLVGLLPLVRAMLGPFIGVLSMIPPLALLPILFVALGLGEVAKVALIVIGITPFLIRDLAQRVAEIPRELIIKAETLGASTAVIAVRVALPQIMPRLILAIRLALGPAWLFLIAAEAIAAESGLGYRIFLVRRYLAMDVILAYVIWITLLAFLMDLGLRWMARRLYPWAGAETA